METLSPTIRALLDVALEKIDLLRSVNDSSRLLMDEHKKVLLQNKGTLAQIQLVADDAYAKLKDIFSPNATNPETLGISITPDDTNQKLPLQSVPAFIQAQNVVKSVEGSNQPTDNLLLTDEGELKINIDEVVTDKSFDAPSTGTGMVDGYLFRSNTGFVRVHVNDTAVRDKLIETYESSNNTISFTDSVLPEKLIDAKVTDKVLTTDNLLEQMYQTH